MTSSIRATHGLLVVMLATVPMSAVRATPPLIVVEDRGGASALPYYEALDLQPRQGIVSEVHLRRTTPRPKSIWQFD